MGRAPPHFPVDHERRGARPSPPVLPGSARGPGVGGARLTMTQRQPSQPPACARALPGSRRLLTVHALPPRAHGGIACLSLRCVFLSHQRAWLRGGRGEGRRHGAGAWPERRSRPPPCRQGPGGTVHGVQEQPTPESKDVVHAPRMGWGGESGSVPSGQGPGALQRHCGEQVRQPHQEKNPPAKKNDAMISTAGTAAHMTIGAPLATEFIVQG